MGLCLVQQDQKRLALYVQKDWQNKCMHMNGLKVHNSELCWKAHSA